MILRRIIRHFLMTTVLVLSLSLSFSYNNFFFDDVSRHQRMRYSPNHVFMPFSQLLTRDTGGTVSPIQQQKIRQCRIISIALWSTEGNSVSPTSTSSFSQTKQQPDSSYDVIVVGSGIGGLCAAAILSLYGYKTCVLESHYRVGGAAHGFDVKGKNGGIFRFDTGPSFFSGLNPKIPAKTSNPLRTVLDAINEPLDCIPYSTFGLKFPEGDFVHTSGFGETDNVLEQISGPAAVKQWKKLKSNMEPLEASVAALPTAALRFDVGGLLTVGPFLPNFAKASPNPLENLKLTKPFQTIIESADIPKNSFTQNWLDLLCFCLSGLSASGTITAEMAMMMGEFYKHGALMDCPVGGAKSIADALTRGIIKFGGEIYLGTHVNKIVIDESKRATSVRLKKGDRVIKAEKAVISNLSVWDLFGSGIVDRKHFPDSFVESKMETPVGKSFMHLHVGFKATRDELEKLQAHYMYIDDWSRGVEAEDNAVLLSIPSVHDTSLAPDGYGVLHIYTPATEDFSRWENVKRNSPEYNELKQHRSQYLWTVLEKVIPDIKDRAEIVRVGTPLTHQRFLRRYRGSYGPAIQAGQGDFPFPGTPVKGLLLCGDSCFPGIGIPAVAGSGLLAAHSVSLQSVVPQLKLLKQLKE